MLAIYCRTSKSREHKYTIENQKDGGRKCAENHNLDYKFYVDDGISGTLDEEYREGFSMLKKDIEKGEITHVYVLDQSRIARDDLIWRYFVALCLNYNIKYMPDGVEFDLDNDMNRIFASLMSVFNKFHTVTTSKKVKLANKKKAELGKTHGLIPYGYNRDEENNFVVAEDEAEIVRLIFKLSLEGHGVYKIAQILNEKGIPTKYRKYFKGNLKRRDPFTKDITVRQKDKIMWRGTVVHGMLKNEIYKGKRTWRTHKEKIDYVDGQKIIKNEVEDITWGNVPAIIQPELFDKVQENFKMNLKEKTGKKCSYNYLLNGIIFCAQCGSQYRGKLRPKGKDSAYKCKSKNDVNSDCQNRALSIQKLDAFLLRYLFLDEYLKETISIFEDNKNEKSEVLSLIKKYKKDVESLKKRLERTIDIASKSKSSEDDVFLEKIDSIKNKISEKNSMIVAFEQKLENNKNKLNKLFEQGGQRINKIKFTDDFFDLRRIVHSIVEWIAIDHQSNEKSGVFTIKLNIKALDEVHYFSTDWKMYDWNLIEIRKVKNDLSVGTSEKYVAKNVFDIKEALNQLENNSNNIITNREPKRIIVDSEDYYDFNFLPPIGALNV